MRFKLGDRVRKTTGDYVFSGTVVSAFHKLSGLTRFVVENDDGVLFIFNDKQIEQDVAIDPERERAISH